MQSLGSFYALREIFAVTFARKIRQIGHVRRGMRFAHLTPESIRRAWVTSLQVLPKKTECKYCELEEVMLPLLRGRVFHVTKQETFDNICQRGWIYSNQPGPFAFSLGQSKNSYGRKRGWVSLFDLSNTTDAYVKEALIRYWFLRTMRKGTHVYSFITESAWPSLISWKRASREVGATEVFIPFVETWYPGDIPLHLVSDSLAVTVQSA